MALSVIVVLYLTIGVLAAVGSVVIARRLFPGKGEQVFFALFLIPIAGFYLAFTAHFRDAAAWPTETAGVAAFALLGLLGVRLPALLALGYFAHGLWDLVHELHAHGMRQVLGAWELTDLPLAYGAFCLAFDWWVVAFVVRRRSDWNAAWRGAGS